MRPYNQVQKVSIFIAPLLLAFSLISCDIRQTSETQYGVLSGTPTPPSPVNFDNGKSSSDIPFRMVDNGMLLTIILNEEVQLEVIFDSGFPMNGILVTKPEKVKKLNLQYVGKTPLGGAGKNSRTAKIAMDATIDLPGVEFTDQHLLIVSEADAFKDWHLDGVIGGTLLNSCVVMIDHDKKVINLFNSAHDDHLITGDEIGLLFSQGIPVVDATVYSGGSKSVDVKLLFDTGADIPLSLHTDIGPDFMAPDDFKECYVSEGIGGAVFGKWARTDSLKIGNYTLLNLLTVYPTRGFEEVVKLLGQNGFFGLVLQNRFNITFDYINRKLYLNPNNRFSRSFEFNMAGLIIFSDNEGNKIVKDVVKGSTGDEAGIKKDDILIAVNNIKIHNICESDLQEFFRQEGKELKLTLERRSKPIRLSLVLERLL